MQFINRYLKMNCINLKFEITMMACSAEIDPFILKSPSSFCYSKLLIADDVEIPFLFRDWNRRHN